MGIPIYIHSLVLHICEGKAIVTPLQTRVDFDFGRSHIDGQRQGVTAMEIVGVKLGEIALWAPPDPAKLVADEVIMESVLHHKFAIALVEGDFWCRLSIAQGLRGGHTRPEIKAEVPPFR